MKDGLSAVLLGVGLLLMPAAIGVALHAGPVWQERLAWPRFVEEPNRHTPTYATGTFLPPVITANRTLTAADNPVIMAKTVRVPAGVSLTIGSGTKLLAHEYALLEVGGQLNVQGTREAPVQFSSNEQHPINQTWGGIIFESGSRGVIAHAGFKAASPAVSCLAGSAVRLENIAITASRLDVFNCVY